VARRAAGGAEAGAALLRRRVLATARFKGVLRGGLGAGRYGGRRGHRAVSERRGERTTARIVSVDPWGTRNAIRDTEVRSRRDGQAVVAAADATGALQLSEGVAEAVVVDAQ